MDLQFLKTLASNQPSTANDGASPLSYLEWVQNKPSIVEKDETYHYNQYLINWFNTHSKSAISPSFLLRQKYLYLLQQLQLFFTEEEKNNWYNKINFADQSELLQAIPYFAKKLRDICLYYLKLRKKLKYTKLKYNTVGTFASIEQEIKSYFLENLVNTNAEIPESMRGLLPSVADLQQNLTITIEPIYDKQAYHDLDPSTVDERFNLLDEATAAFFSTKGISLSSLDWAVGELSFSALSSIDLFVESLTGAFLEQSDEALYASFIEKYIGESKSRLTSSSTTQTNNSSVSIKIGNNVFYYPTGMLFPTEIKTNTTYLSSLVLEGATAGSTPFDSDIIFAETGKGIKSAWLHNRTYDSSSKTVEAVLNKEDITSFIFPYPGYGLSAANVNWTGPFFKTSPSYIFLSQAIKEAISTEYWSMTSLDSCEEIALNDTTLISAGSTPNENPQLSDQLSILKDKQVIDSAWLYKFTTTALPIEKNKTTKILWPYTLLTNENQVLPLSSYEEACDSLPLSSLDITHMVAGSSIDLADQIYFLPLKNSTIDFATEGAWLSGAPEIINNVAVVNQPSLQFSAEAGSYVRFVWLGESGASINDVFKSIPHSSDCSYNPTKNPYDWSSCKCKQVFLSPLGHPGTQFNEYGGVADSIIEDYGTSVLSFNPNALQNTYKFAWFKTDLHPGWTNGKWISNKSLTNAPFTLTRGKTYVYRRASLPFSNIKSPSYNCLHSYGSINPAKFKWIRATIDSREWKSTNAPSFASINPGSTIAFKRNQYTTSHLVSSTTVQTQSKNINSIWSSYDYMPINSSTATYPYNYQSTSYVSWPIVVQSPIGSTDPQYPSVSFGTQTNQISSIRYWVIKNLNTGDVQQISGTSTLTFTPTQTGVYALTAVGNVARLNGEAITISSPYVFTNIPYITAVGIYTQEPTYIPIKTDASGFVLEQPLSGWDYTTNTQARGSAGAKPYWAVLYADKNIHTNYKTVQQWGYPNTFVGEFLPYKQPLLSPIVLKFGDIIEYSRKGPAITWIQPFTFKKYVGTPQWCNLSTTILSSSNLSAIFETEKRPQYVVNYDASPTDIVLSNYVDGAPLKIYYNALNTFTWEISSIIETNSTASSSVAYNSLSPWNNLTNRFFATVATIPSLEKTYTQKDVGGYFLPQNTGASQFINKEFTIISPLLSTDSIDGDFTVHIGGRGLTTTNQPTLYSWAEQNNWLKTSSTAGELAGTPQKLLTQTLQTFIPYQSNDQNESLGPITPISRLTPWGGIESSVWSDTNNIQQSFTGVYNVSAWADTQILKNTSMEMISWSSDVFGNQYCLFKESGAEAGSIWIRQNNQSVVRASAVLSGTEINFDDVIQFECFYNTLMIQTRGTFAFASLVYDYENASLQFGSITYKPSSDMFNDFWFNEIEKKVVVLCTEPQDNNTFIPTFYSYDLNDELLEKIYPTNLLEKNKIAAALEDIQYDSLQSGKITYDSSTNTFLITFFGLTTQNKAVLCNIEAKLTGDFAVKKIVLFKDEEESVNTPPVFTQLPIYNFTRNTDFEVQAQTTNGSATYSLLTTTIPVTITSSGKIQGKIQIPGTYHINFKASNEIGSSYGCITIRIT